MKGNWDIHIQDEEVVLKLSEALGIPYLLAYVLAARGFTDPMVARDFLTPSLERDWLDPTLIPDLGYAVDVLIDAIKHKKQVLIFGDFDVDGITSTAVMMLSLHAFGLDPTPFIPRRQDEGYGLSCEAIDRILIASDEGKIPRPDLLITVDCGVTSAKETEYLKSKGIDVVITDHHNLQDEIPQGVPVCNPKLKPDCGSVELAGVGVALKISQELGRRLGKPDLWLGLCDLAALGTIADRMPLYGENRALVAYGVQSIREHPRPGIAMSLELAGDNYADVDAISLSFSLIPRMNAAGRIADAELALDFLLEEDPVKAAAIARYLEDINTQRRACEVELTECAEEVVSQTYDGQHVLIISGEAWHEGVKGIVASRLAIKYGVPTILFTIKDGIAHGSGRSVGELDLFRAIESVSDLLETYGGHKYAVGVSVKKENLDEFHERLEEYFEQFPQSDFVNRVEIDGIISFDELTMDQVASLKRLEPFGQDNPEPVFAITSAFINRARAVGAKKNHLSFTITNGAEDASAIYFHCSDTEEYVSLAAPVDLVFSAQIEDFRGHRQLKLKVKDMAPSLMSYHQPQTASNQVGDFINELYSKTDQILAKPAIPTETLSNDLREERAVWILPTNEDEDFGSFDIDQELCIAFTGSKNKLYRSQREALESLWEGQSTLAVMATGRGKSLIFYIHAAKCALMRGTQSIFIYPLRSLINDQAFHIGQIFARIGLTVQTLTGETSREDREKIYESWREGETDVLLTTPEFLDANSEQIAANSCLSFIAIDEAHHIASEAQSYRPAYKRLSFLTERFPYAEVLAVTATAPKPYADVIVETLGIKRIVTDPFIRTNLTIDDRRDIHDRATYLASIVAMGQKTIVYVNSRQATIDIAKMLRKRLPDLAIQIAFYNAALSREVRNKVEEMFREGELKVVVATGAFGEGVNVADVSHVVIYNLPVSPLSYNQMAGRAGRDGHKATVHLLFGKEDVKTGQAILSKICPDRSVLELIYKAMLKIDHDFNHPSTEEEILALCHLQKEGASITLEAIRSSISVFSELGLIEIDSSEAEKRFIINKDVKKVDLKSSSRYREAQIEIQTFNDFSRWLLVETPDGLLTGINRPLLPR